MLFHWPVLLHEYVLACSCDAVGKLLLLLLLLLLLQLVALLVIAISRSVLLRNSSCSGGHMIRLIARESLSGSERSSRESKRKTLSSLLTRFPGCTAHNHVTCHTYRANNKRRCKIKF